jgi:hypothetical protein
VFETPTQFAKETARAAQGLSKKIFVNGWIACYTKDRKGRNVPLNESRRGVTECVKEGSSILHGLLTEPFPSFSTLYGSPLFWKSLEHGDLPDSWIEEAEAVDEKAKERCRKAGSKFYEVEVQRDDTCVEEMVKKPLPKPETISQANRIEQYTKKFDKIYHETSEEPEKLPTDTQKIWKEEFNGKEVWQCEAGFVFADDAGKPGKLLGKYVADVFTKF